jgi:hypothetical protein
MEKGDKCVRRQKIWTNWWRQNSTPSTSQLRAAPDPLLREKRISILAVHPPPCPHSYRGSKWFKFQFLHKKAKQINNKIKIVEFCIKLFSLADNRKQEAMAAPVLPHPPASRGTQRITTGDNHHRGPSPPALRPRATVENSKTQA